jgi:hypothetical protein
MEMRPILVVAQRRRETPWVQTSRWVSVFDFAGNQRRSPEHADQHRQDQEEQPDEDDVLVVVEERTGVPGAAAVGEGGVVQARGVRLRRLVDASG